MTPALRCFIALDISDALKQKIGRSRDQAFASDLGIRWVKPENLHLTLKFLGDAPLKSIEDIIKTLDSLELPPSPIQLQFNRIGAFPDLKHPRIIWLGSDDNAVLTRLAGDLDNSLALIGFTKEKREFKPHMTIGRTKPDHDAQGIAQFIKTATDLMACEENINVITLYKSTLSPQGPHYDLLHRRYFKT